MAVQAPDTLAICVTPERFGEHLRMLVDRYVPLSLTDFLEGLAAGTLPSGAVSLTFDDGYADNALVALPLLREFGVPATVFVCTATLGTTAEFWWDRLQAVFLTPGPLPRRVSLRTGLRPFRADLGADCEYTEEMATDYANWSVRDGAPPTLRHETFLRLFRRIQRLDGSAAEVVVKRLESWAGRPMSIRDTHRSLSVEEIAALRDSGLIEIGAHTVHHPLLSKLRRAERAEEINASRDTLAKLVGPVRHFAYPFGDFKGSVPLAEAAGFASACTTQPGLASSASDRHQLPRVYVGDWSATQLAARLTEISAGPN